MNKKLKIALCSVFIIVLLAVILELFTYIKDRNRLIKEGYRINKQKLFANYPIGIKTFSQYYEKEKQNNGFFYTLSGNGYKTSPILLFGDVFAKELDTIPEQSFAAKLSKATKHPVYNYASAGWGLQQMYYIIKNDKNLNNIKNVETIIFVYTPYMLERMYSYSYYPHNKFLNLKYKLNNGVLVEENPIFLPLYNSYFIRNIERKQALKQFNKNTDTTYNNKIKLVKHFFIDSRKEAKNKYPKLKNFIILCYDLNEDSMGIWNDLKKLGFNVIEVKDLTKTDLSASEYYNPDSSPNEKAYNIVVPAFVKKAGLVETTKKKKHIKKAVPKKPATKKKSIQKQETKNTIQEKQENNIKEKQENNIEEKTTQKIKRKNIFLRWKNKE